MGGSQGRGAFFHDEKGMFVGLYIYENGEKNKIKCGSNWSMNSAHLLADGEVKLFVRK